MTEGPTDDLHQIIGVNQDKDRGWRDFIPRVKLLFSASEINKAIQDLDSTANSLFRLTSLIASNQQPAEQLSSRKALTLGRGLRQARRVAIELHQTIRTAWKSSCHDNHEAKLLLEDRIENAAKTFKGVRSNGDFSTMGFQLIFAASSPPRGPSWHEATVKVPCDLTYDDPNPSYEPSIYRTTRVTLALSNIPSTRPEIPFVNDICAVLGSISRDQKQVALVLSKDQRMGMVASSKNALAACDHTEKMPLKTLLSDTESTVQRANFPLKPRMMLALGLASNLLQLSRTPWLQPPWSKEKVFFLRRPDAAGGQYDFTRPFISLTFNSEGANAQIQHIDSKAAFLELGILLLEIWNRQTLEMHFPGHQGPLGYYQRLALAMEWLDDMSNPVPDLYERAVSHCIRGMICKEARFCDWEDSKFWGAVCQDVIGPLHEICKQWRSLPR
ncbi:MAG: hypothetical protein Q9191_007249 [Dirinaria sp. TL-2023a]